MTDILRALFRRLLELEDQANAETDPGCREFVFAEINDCKRQILKEIALAVPACEASSPDIGRRIAKALNNDADSNPAAT